MCVCMCCLRTTAGAGRRRRRESERDAMQMEKCVVLTAFLSVWELTNDLHTVKYCPDVSATWWCWWTADRGPSALYLSHTHTHTQMHRHTHTLAAFFQTQTISFSLPPASTYHILCSLAAALLPLHNVR